MKTVEQMMAHRVYERLLELLRETDIAKEIGDGEFNLLSANLAFDISFVLPTEGSHRKAAVALGLLGAHHSTEDAARFFKNRAPERHGVLGLDLWLNDQNRRIPWYRPFGPPAQDDPSQFETFVPVAEAPPVAAVAPAMPAMPPMTPVAPAMPAMPTMPAVMPPPVGVPSPMGAAYPGFAMPLEMVAFALVQQWPMLAAQAAASGMAPAEFAQRQLWQQVVTQAAQGGQSPERMLASQQWQKLMQTMVMPGMTPEQLAWVQNQQMTFVSAQAAQRGQTPEGFLAAQRWEQLTAMLTPPPDPTGGGFPPMPGIPPMPGMPPFGGTR